MRELLIGCLLIVLLNGNVFSQCNYTISTSSTNATCGGCTDGTTTAIAPQPNKFKPFTPTSSYGTFFGGYNLPFINDSNFTDGTLWGSGTPDPFELTMTFTFPVMLDTVKVMGGQFNGNFNIPIEMNLYRGTSGGTLLTTITPTYTLDKYGFSNTVGSTVYTWVIRPAASGYAAIREIQCFSSELNTYTYAWDDPGVQTTPTAAGLGAGMYHVTVTNQNSCSRIDSARVCELLTSIVITNVTCNGSSNGAADLTPSNGTPLYTYNWSNGAVTQDLSGVAGGTYYVTVTDANSCTQLDTAIISEPTALTTSTTGTNPTCVPCTDGAVDLTVSGGIAAYSYSWSTGAITEDISGLANGTYYVTVTDANSCTKVDSSIIASCTPSSFTLAATNISCNGANDGAVDLTVSLIGSSGPKNYTPTASFNTFFGGYNLSFINDGNLSDGTLWGAGTTDPFELTMTFDSLVRLDSVRIRGGQYNGDFNIPLEMKLYRGTSAGTLLATIIPTYTMDTYTFSNTIKDTIYTWVIRPAANGYAGIREIMCYGSTSQEFTYAWTGPNAFSSTTQDISGLEAGWYYVTVTEDGCWSNDSAQIINPATLTTSTSPTNASCDGCSDGAVDLTVSGGTVAYSYNWSTGAITQDISGLVPGTYVVTVTDAGSCTSTKSTVVSGSTCQLWAKATGGTFDDIGYSVVTDASGNVYTTGNFQGTVDFEPGAGTSNLTSVGATDVFVQKFDASGNFVWAKAMGGTFSDYGQSVAVDASGNVHVAGYFTGTVDFDPGAGTFNITSIGGTDIFVQKLDASGNFVWAKAMGGGSNDVGYSIAVDATSNVYLTGRFQGTSDFDPGAGTFNISSVGGADVFVQKLDASGNLVWAKAVGGTFSDYGQSIAVDGSGNVHVAGYFAGTADFDPGAGTFNITSAGGNDIFVLKLNPSGNFIWAKATGGSSNDFGYSMALDASGNVHATGYFTGTADFDPGAGTSNLTSTGGSDVFIQKLDASGNFVWAKAIGGTTNDIGYSISLASDGSVHTTGSFTGTVDFDPGADAFNITSTGSTDIFIHQLDASGNFTSAKQVGGSISDVAYSISLDAAENVYITGFFYGTVDFNPDTGTLNLTSVGASDIFFTKYCSGNLCSIILSNSVINATCGVCTDGSVDLTVSSGAFPLTYAWSTGAATEDISGLTNGTYYVTVTNSDGCAATDSAIVGQSCAFTMSFSTTHATCGTNNDGAVNMNINGAGSSIKENYTPTSNYNTFYSIYNLTYINDGDSTKGTIWGGGTPNPYELTMTFSSSVQLDSVRIKAGQFNGNYNKPVEMRLYRGTTAGTLLSTITPSYNYTGNSFANGGSNTVYTWEITPAASGYASILEIECYTSAGGVTYTYAWTGPNAFSATTQDISGLESGTYNVTATSNITGCPVNQSVIVIEESPNISLSFSKTNVTSNGGSDGAIDMTVNWSSALNYTATSNYSTFYSIYDLSYINDGDLTKGTIWGSGTPNPFELTMTFGSTYQIDSVRIRAGQFNGDYSKPQQMKLYRGTTAGTLLTTIIPSNSVTGYSFANAGTNTVYTWEITPATNGYASILEIECYSSSFSGTFTYSWTGPNSFTATTEDISALQAGTYYVTVTNTSNGCGKTGNTTITEPAAFTSQGETLTEINEPIETATQNVRLNVYPNPTNGVVNINIAGLDDESAILVIYDAFGSEVYRSIPQHIGSSYEHTWHFGNQLASGIYLLAIQTESKLYHRKIILKR